MLPVSVSKTGTGRSSVVALDNYQRPFDVGIQAIVSGTATYTIQYTMDDIFASGYSAASGNWFDSDQANLVGATTSQTGNFQYPCRAASINVTAGSGTVTATFLQGISGN